MENKQQVLQAILQMPKCISHYYEDWKHNLRGCLFFDGKNLCVLNTPYRRMDTFVVSEIHQEELVICLGEKFVYIYGRNKLCAIFAYAQNHLLNHKAMELLEINELDDIWDYPYFNATHILLDEWNMFLTKILPISRAHNNCFRPALDYTERYLHKYIQSHSYITRVQDLMIDLVACVKIANHKKNVVLRSLTPHIYCEEDEFKVDGDSNDLLSILINHFYYFSLYSVTNWSISEDTDVLGDYNPELLGITACVACKAINANNMRNDPQFLDSPTYRDMTIPREDLQSEEYVKFISNWKKRPHCYSTESSGPSHLRYISFTLNADKNKLYEFYSKLILPFWKYTAKYSPDIPAIFSSNQMIYSFLLVAEQKMLDYSMQSDIWATLEEPQQKALKGYADGYFIYLRNIYHADERLFFQALEVNKLAFDDVYIDFPKTTNKHSNFKWHIVNSWLIDKKEVPTHYLEDYNNFHTIMNRYLDDKKPLDTILQYLLRYDGVFLTLPRHHGGKSDKKLNQKAIREGLEQAGFSFKKSRYSRILSGL